MPTITLGPRGPRIAPLGVGTWAWGDKGFWSYPKGYGPADLVDAFLASADAGLTLFDTAEVYGHGESEKILGFMARRYERAALCIATTFALLPGRAGARALPAALAASLRRLGRPRVDLYQLHWPDTAMASLESVMGAMADAVDAGTVGAVGVSNCTAEEVRVAHAALAARGVPLATSQVHYSLLDRSPESNGMLSMCQSLGVTVLAYSPLAQGLLCGRWGPGALPEDGRARSALFSTARVAAAPRVVSLLRALGDAHGQRPPEQVALRWLIQARGVVPLAGAKTGAQARRNAGALDFTLRDDELRELDAATSDFLAG